MAESTELTCKLCHTAVDFKKELSEGYCFNCSQKLINRMERDFGSYEANLMKDADKKWLQKLQRGKTAAKYSGISPIKIPACFYKERKDLTGS